MDRYSRSKIVVCVSGDKMPDRYLSGMVGKGRKRVSDLWRRIRKRGGEGKIFRIVIRD